MRSEIIVILKNKKTDEETIVKSLIEACQITLIDIHNWILVGDGGYYNRGLYVGRLWIERYCRWTVKEEQLFTKEPGDNRWSDAPMCKRVIRTKEHWEPGDERDFQ